MAGKEESIGSEAKSLAKDAVSSFGLIELILGGVGLYGLWLLFRPKGINELFLQTGHDFIDIGLLGFAALLLGKIIYLFSYILMAFVIVFLERDSENSTYSQLKKSVSLHTGNTANAENLVSDQGEKDPTKMAESILTSASANNYAAEIVQKKNKILISYGTALLLIPYFFHICRSVTNGFAIAVVPLTIIIFLLLGFYQQRALMKDMAASLVTLYLNRKQKVAEAQSRQGDALGS